MFIMMNWKACVFEKLNSSDTFKIAQKATILPCIVQQVDELTVQHLYSSTAVV